MNYSQGSIAVLIALISVNDMEDVTVVTQAVNEIAVPVGCSLILFATKILSR